MSDDDCIHGRKHGQCPSCAACAACDGTCGECPYMRISDHSRCPLCGQPAHDYRCGA